MKDILFKKFQLSDDADLFVPMKKKSFDGKEKLIRRKKIKEVKLNGKMSKEQDNSLKKYRNGGEGFILWCEDHIHLAIYKEGATVPTWIPMNQMPEDKHPETGRSYKDMWEMQKPILRKALAMENGRFLYRLIVLCWMRGDGKSLIACLIQLWKFFCFPRQQIMLGANSKDQVKFVHYDIMREIIQNSPKLLKIIGRKNIQEKEMRLVDSKKRVISIVRSISSFSGIVSNITGYTFSEIFDMKNPKFFVQLDGSIRNMPNALGVIDSTVSEKSHILYKLYESSLASQGDGSNLTYFSYRCSPAGAQEDFFNPQMTQKQLDDYRRKFPAVEFARYFQNLWDTGITRLFSDEVLEAMRYIGMGSKLVIGGDTIQKLIKEKNEKKKLLDIPEDERRFPVNVDEIKQHEKTLYSLLTPISDIYRLDYSTYFCDMANSYDLDKLTEIFDTNWVIGCGVDRADPMKEKQDGARTIVSFIAKGLKGSRSNPAAYTSENSVNQYLYVVLGIVHIASSSLEDIKAQINLAENEYQYIDTFCSERWGMFDIEPWLVDKDIDVDIIHPSPAKQKEGFSELFVAVNNERFKCPPIGYHGSKKQDILYEEMEIVETTPGKDWYGSPEKFKSGGIQDDSVFSVVWNIYGLRFKTVDDMQPRVGKDFLGQFIQNKQLLGSY